jgi:hypothetical protein
MPRAALFAGLLAISLSGAAALAQTDAPEPETAPPARKLIEIYRIAPGKHEEFLRFIAELDDINVKAGLPPRDLYVHNDGAGWDFIIIQPASTPPDKAEALSRAWDEAGAPSGANFFLKIREYIVEHSDTFATGPTSARAYLSGVDHSE